MPKYLIRRLRKTDRLKWIEFYKNLSIDTIVYRHGHCLKNTDDEVCNNEFNQTSRAFTLIIENKDKIIGCIELDRFNDTGEIALTIADEYQGNGLGTILMEKIEKIARMKELKSIYFETLSSNSRMKKIGMKLGYEKNNKYYIYTKML